MPHTMPVEPPSREEAALIAVQNRTTQYPGVASIARQMSHFGEHSLGWLVLAGIGAIIGKERRAQFLTAGIGAFGAHAASVIIKRIVRRPRPDHPDITIGVSTPSRLSFPSSHATSTTAGAILLARAVAPKKRLMWALPVVVVGAMGTSRLVLGVHYPTDVLAGTVIGAATAGACIAAENAVLHK